MVVIQKADRSIDDRVGRSQSVLLGGRTQTESDIRKGVLPATSGAGRASWKGGGNGASKKKRERESEGRGIRQVQSFILEDVDSGC